MINRRRLLQITLAATATSVVPDGLYAQATPEPEDLGLVAFMDVHGDDIESAYASMFAIDGANFADITSGSPLILVSIGVQLRQGRSVQEFIDGAYT